jgi:hypothetical protein
VRDGGPEAADVLGRHAVLQEARQRRRRQLGLEERDGAIPRLLRRRRVVARRGVVVEAVLRAGVLVGIVYFTPAAFSAAS